MNESDIAALMRGAAPAIRDLVVAIVRPLVERIAGLEGELTAWRAVDHNAVIQASVEAAVTALPPAPPGKDADPVEMQQMIDAAVAALPPPEPGKDADPTAVKELVLSAVSKAVAAIPPAEPGRDADPIVVAELVRTEVERAIATIPAPQDGKSITLDEVAPLVEQAVAKAVAELPPAKDGEPGAPGLLPVAKTWTDDVAYAGEVRSHAGSTWQALRDTAKEPPHTDWICLAGRGADGKAADEIEVRGTFDAEGAYRRLNIVALNGSAFMAKTDDPGVCPGEGWQVIAMRGKAGQPGEARKGDPGQSIKGPAGDAVVGMSIDDEGMLVLVNGDGSTVTCDLYPLLSKLGGAA